MREFGSCETIIDYSKIVIAENNSKITFLNNSGKKIKKIKVDNCVIKQGLRCDYLIIDSFDIEYFIELKGADINHAIKQIETSIVQLSDDKYQSNKFAFIISTRCPLTSATIQNHKSIFKKKYNTKLVIHNTPYQESI